MSGLINKKFKLKKQSFSLMNMSHCDFGFHSSELGKCGEKAVFCLLQLVCVSANCLSVLCSPINIFWLFVS